MPSVIPLAVALTVVLCIVTAASGNPSSTATESQTIDNDYHIHNISEEYMEEGHEIVKRSPIPPLDPVSKKTIKLLKALKIKVKTKIGVKAAATIATTIKLLTKLKKAKTVKALKIAAVKIAATVKKLKALKVKAKKKIGYKAAAIIVQAIEQLTSFESLAKKGIIAGAAGAAGAAGVAAASTFPLPPGIGSSIPLVS